MSNQVVGPGPKIAQIPQTSVTDPQLRPVVEAVRNIFNTRAFSKNPLDRWVTWRDLVDSDVVVYRDGNKTYTGGGGNGSGFIPLPGGENDFTPPPAPTGFTADGAFHNILLDWDEPTELYSNHSYTEIWRSGTNDLGTAVLIGQAPGAVYADPVGTSSTYYYWIRFVSRASVVGPYNSLIGTEGQTALDPGYLLETLTGAITESQLYTSLGEKIDLIDLIQAPATVPNSVAAQIQVEANARAQAILAEATARETGLTAEALARSNAITAEATARQNAITAESLARIAGISAEAQARNTALIAEATARQADFEQEVLDRTAAIAEESAARAAAILAEATARQAAITTEQTTRQTADDSLASSITTLTAAVDADVNTLSAAIQSETSARVSGDSANASSINTLAARVNNVKDSNGVATNKTLEATLVDNKQAQIDGDTALSSSISSLTATVSNNYSTLNSAIISESTARADADSAFSTTLNSLTATVTNNYNTLNSAIASESSARATALSAEASARDSLAAQLRGNYSGSDLTQITSGLLYSERVARVTEDAALSTRIDTIVAASSGDFQDLFAAIAQEETARISGDNASATSISTLTARLDNVKDQNGVVTNKSIESTLVDDRQARVDADTAISSTVSALQSTVTGNYNTLNAAITSEATTRANADSANATSISGLTARLSNVKDKNGVATNKTIEATLVDDRQSRVDGDTALSTSISNLSATVTGNYNTLNSAITSEATARATADTANTTAINTISARLSNVKDKNGVATDKTIEATLVDNKQAQVDGDSALSTSISNLSATVTNNYNALNSAITTESTTRANAISAEASSRTTLATQMRGNYTGTDVTQISSGLIFSERTARVAGDSSLQTQITNLSASVATDVSDLTAAIQDEETARAAGDAAEATSRQTLAAQLRGAYTGTDVAQLTTGLLHSERTARVSADSAISSTVTALSSTVSNNYNTLNSAITSEATTRATADTTLTTNLNALTSTVTNNNNAVNAAIASEATTRANADTAISNTVSSLSSTVTNNYNTLNAAITSEATTRANADSALTTQVNTVSAQATKARTYRQAAAPTTGMIAGDMWFDSDDNNKAYRYSGTAWVATDDTRISANAAAIQTESTARANADSSLATQINTVQSIANAKNKVYRQAAAPTGTLTEGDLWFDSDDGNKAYRYSGTAWVATDDTRIAANTAAIQTESTTRANADSALSTQITTVQAVANQKNRIYRQTSAPTVNLVTGDLWFDTDDNNKPYRWTGIAWDSVEDPRIQANSVSIQTEATARANADNSLFAQYTVKIDANGYVSGFGLASTTVGAIPTSDFIIRADKFSIASPTGPNITPIVPFAVTTTTQTINGVSVPPGVYMDAAFIKNGTITNAKIGFAAIDSAKIADAAITAAKIGEAAITTAKIQDGTIIGAKIAMATITSANIQNAAIGTAQIADATITTAKIAGTIQSDNYSSTTGWQINRSGTMYLNQANIRGELNVGASAGGYAWPPGSGNGVHISQYGILVGNANAGGRYMQIYTPPGDPNAYIYTNIPAYIESGQITNGHIANGSITNAKISDAEITTAKIGTAQIDTLRIAGNAVTVAAASAGTGTQTVYLNAPQGGMLTIIAQVDQAANANGNNRLNIYINGGLAEIVQGNQVVVGSVLINSESGETADVYAWTQAIRVRAWGVGAGTTSVTFQSTEGRYYTGIALLTQR